MRTSDRERRLGALAELCRELVKYGLQVGMSDARPALSLRTRLVDRRLWVEIDPEGEAFVWRRDDHERHATDDPAGAAARLAEYVNLRAEDEDGRP